MTMSEKRTPVAHALDATSRSKRGNLNGGPDQHKFHSGHLWTLDISRPYIGILGTLPALELQSVYSRGEKCTSNIISTMM
jgi:hypothetical protein